MRAAARCALLCSFVSFLASTELAAAYADCTAHHQSVSCPLVFPKTIPIADFPIDIYRASSVGDRCPLLFCQLPISRSDTDRCILWPERNSRFRDRTIFVRDSQFESREWRICVGGEPSCIKQIICWCLTGIVNNDDRFRHSVIINNVRHFGAGYEYIGTQLAAGGPNQNPNGNY